MINIFEQIKSRVTARQAAEYYGLKVERNGMACCPFHDDKHPSMKIDQKLDYWIEILCFGTEEEKKEFFLQNQREVKEFEGKLFRAGKTILDRNWDGIKQRMCG